MTGETFKGTIICEGPNGTAIVNDFGWVDLAGGSAHLDCGAGAAAFQALVKVKWLAILPDNVFIQRWRFACVSGQHKGEIGYVAEATPPPGDQDGTTNLPQEIAIAFKRWTGYAPRRDRGRVFFGPVAATYQNATTRDFCTNDNADLLAACALLKSDLSVGGITLNPVILASDGSYGGHTIINSAVAAEFVHRKSRRLRVGA